MSMQQKVHIEAVIMCLFHAKLIGRRKTFSLSLHPRSGLVSFFPPYRYDSLGFYYARDASKSDNNNGSNETANL